jgi:hypothetical protein
MSRLFAILLLALAACASGAEEPLVALEEAEALPLQIAFQGLCQSRAAAEAGDVLGASGVFQSRAHAELHTLADRLSATDRDAAARLLEAKQRLEAAFEDPAAASPPVVAGLISAVEAEVANGAEALGLQRPTCEGAGV